MDSNLRFFCSIVLFSISIFSFSGCNESSTQTSPSPEKTTSDSKSEQNLDEKSNKPSDQKNSTNSDKPHENSQSKNSPISLSFKEYSAKTGHLKSSVITALNGDFSGVLVGTDNHGFYYYKNGSFSECNPTTPCALGNNQVSSIHSLGKSIIVGAGKTASLSAGSLKKAFRIFHFNSPVQSVLWTDIMGDTFVGTSNGLYQVHFLLGTVKPVHGILPNQNIKALSLDSGSNKLYVGTEGGLSISANMGDKFETSDESTSNLINNHVTSLFLHNKTLFVGTEGGLSISKDSGKTFSNIKKEPSDTAQGGLADDHVNVVSAVKSFVFVGTNRGLSISLDGGSSFFSFDSASNVGLRNDHILSLEYRGTSNNGIILWLGTKDGLYVSDEILIPGT